MQKGGCFLFEENNIGKTGWNVFGGNFSCFITAAIKTMGNNNEQRFSKRRLSPPCASSWRPLVTQVDGPPARRPPVFTLAVCLFGAKECTMFG